VFGFGHDEIAAAVGRSPAAVRQMAHRAREHVQARRKRFDHVDATVGEQITAQFFATAATGDVAALIELLAPDVVWTADSAGKVSAARRPVTGADKVARLVLGLMRGAAERAEARVDLATYNNAPALVLYLGEQLEGVITVEITGGKISHFYAMRNPDKLAAITIPRAITR
jgi:RNA polymerase sigma-70 factor (ECF subfamily)